MWKALTPVTGVSSPPFAGKETPANRSRSHSFTRGQKSACTQMGTHTHTELIRTLGEIKECILFSRKHSTFLKLIVFYPTKEVLHNDDHSFYKKMY